VVVGLYQPLADDGVARTVTWKRRPTMPVLCSRSEDKEEKTGAGRRPRRMLGTPGQSALLRLREDCALLRLREDWGARPTLNCGVDGAEPPMLLRVAPEQSPCDLHAF